MSAAIAYPKPSIQWGAHRGATAVGIAENTLAAFEQAVALGAGWVEFDVHRTADGVWVIHHDAEIGGQTIRGMTWAEIQAIAPQVPTLPAVVQALKGRICLDVELKEVGYEAEIGAYLLDHLGVAEFVITSFQPRSVAAVKARFPQVQVGWLLDAVPDWDQMAALGPDFLAPHWSLLTAEVCHQATNRGLPLWTWTVNDPGVMAELIERRVVEVILTDELAVGLAL